MGKMYQRNKNIINMHIRNYIQFCQNKKDKFMDASCGSYMTITLNNVYHYSTWRISIDPEIVNFRAVSAKDDSCVFICADIKPRISNIQHGSFLPPNGRVINMRDPVYKELYCLLFNDKIRWKSENIRRDEPELDRVTYKDADESPSILTNSHAYMNLYDGYTSLALVEPKSKLVDKIYPKLPEREMIIPIAVFTDDPVPMLEFINQYDSSVNKLNPPSCRKKAEVLRRDEYYDSVRYLRSTKYLSFQVYESGLTESDKTYRFLM